MPANISALPLRQHHRIGVAWRVSFLMVGLGLASTLGMLPFALLASTGLLRTVGFGYAAAYTILVLAPSGQPMLMLMVDALLILARRPTLFLGGMVESMMREPPASLPRRTLQRLVTIGLISTTLNPLTGITLSMLAAVMRLRPQEFVQVWEEARQRAARTPRPTPQAQAQARLVEPVLGPIGELEQELQLC